MHKLEKMVLAQLRRAGLGSNQTLLLAVSGGRDSVVLGEILHQLGQPFAVAHVNYNLRGADSIADAALVQQLCEKWQCIMHLKSSSREELGANIQQGARTVRYAWMRELCTQHAYPAFLTAHHQADQAETFLLAAFKGRGSKAMAGMRAFDGRLLRPLLDCPKELLAAYAHEQKLTWREDMSNDSLAYDRNFIRHNVLGVARSRFPQLEALLAREANRLQQLEALAAEQLEIWRDRLVKQVDADFQRWSSLDLPASYGDWILGRLASENGLEQDAIAAFLELIRKEAGKKLEAAGWTIVRTRTGVDWFKNLKEPSFDIKINAPGCFSLPVGILEMRLVANFEEQAACCIPSDLLLGNLMVRYWQQGDRMCISPNAHKKISDLLQEQQINYRDRLHTLVLASGQDVLWVIGLRKRTFDPSVATANSWLIFNWLP